MNVLDGQKDSSWLPAHLKVAVQEAFGSSLELGAVVAVWARNDRGAIARMLAWAGGLATRTLTSGQALDPGQFPATEVVCFLRTTLRAM